MTISKCAGSYSLSPPIIAISGFGRDVGHSMISIIFRNNTYKNTSQEFHNFYLNINQIDKGRILFRNEEYLKIRLDENDNDEIYFQSDFIFFALKSFLLKSRIKKL